MSLVNSIGEFCIKYKRIICLIIFILLAVFLKKLSESMKEGLELNSCDLFNSNQLVEKNCANCLAVKLVQGNTNSKCYWNSSNKTCGSFLDTGYSDKCDSDTVPKLQLLDTPTWIADPKIKSAECSTCPKLTLADTPTWITKP